MAYFEKRGDAWRAVIQRKNAKKQSKTFQTKASAETWARSVEHKLDNGHVLEKTNGYLGPLLRRYAYEVSENKESGSRWEVIRLKRFEREIGDLRLDRDLTHALIQWRDDRLTKVTSGSVKREFGLLSSVFTHAKKEWRMALSNPLKDMRWPKDNPVRTRRISPEEEAMILEDLKFNWEKPPVMLKDYTPWIFLFALETAMRRGEILSLTWEQVHDKWVQLDRTKNGDSRTVPLSKKARRIIECMPKAGERVFMVRPGTFDTYWRNKRPAGLHFHDTRATALSRLAPKFQPMELAKISGHRDLNMLLNTYYRPTPDELADRLD